MFIKYTNHNGTNTQIQKYINTQIIMTTDPGQEVLWMKAPSLALLFLSLLVPARKMIYEDDTMMIMIVTFLLLSSSIPGFITRGNFLFNFYILTSYL